MNRNDFYDYMRNNVFRKRESSDFAGTVKWARGFWIDSYLSGIVLIVIGILFASIPLFITSSLGIIVGLFLIGYGIVSFITYFFDQQRNDMLRWYVAIRSVVFILFGSAMLRNPLMLASMITYLVGLGFLIESVIKVRGMLMIPGRRTISWWVTFILASAVAALGLFIMIYPMKGIETVMIFTGVILGIRGIQKIAESWRTRHFL